MSRCYLAYLQYAAVLDLIISSHAQPYCHCPSLPMRVKNVFELRSISGLIWCPCLASGKKKSRMRKILKTENIFFRDNQALLLCKACQMTYKVKTTSGHHAFLSERWQISRSVQSAQFLEEQCFIQGQKKETRDSFKMEIHTFTISVLDPTGKKNIKESSIFFIFFYIQLKESKSCTVTAPDWTPLFIRNQPTYCFLTIK